MFLIDAFLVGIAFYSIKEHFHWKISPRVCLVILFFIFAFLEYYVLPMFSVLDVTYTVGNTDIAKLLDLGPNEHVTDLYGFGLFEFIAWSVQAFLASYIGNKVVSHKNR